uniref:APC membrane recruitment protein 2 n=1 Tax=Canis lupus familiaris TaxID=9615 RepID=A0A8C0TM27_CANLF
METSAGRGGGGGGGGQAVSERGGGGASAGGCRRKAEAEAEAEAGAGAGAGTLAADMDSHCDCAAETPPAAEQPSGRINKAAFKLFKKRRSGGTMPSIFGVRNKGDGKGSGPAGMVRSRTHDGLAEVLVLESGRKEEPRGGGGGGGGGGGRPHPGPPRPAGPGAGSLGGSSVAKSHSFFSLLRKNGRPESGRGEPADAGKAGGKQKRGLKGLFSSMRWHRKDKRAKAEAKGERAGAPGGLILPGSLTASLECVQEEAPAPAPAPAPAFDSLTGCGDIIADPEDEAGPGRAQHGPGPGQPGPPRRSAGVVAYQGGGEEMASPDELDHTYLQEFWDMLAQAEDQGGPGGAGAGAGAGGDARGAEGARDAPPGRHPRLDRGAPEPPPPPPPPDQPTQPRREPPAAVPNGDQGCWASPPGPGPEEDGPRASAPRQSPSGDAPRDPHADPAARPASDETPGPARLKPVSPVTITCPLRTPGTLPKDSKIPISIKHLAGLPSSHPVVHQQPVRSEMPRTKIPVSKVLVRRVSSRGLAGTTLRAAACHDSAKKL